jgi:ammonium transporter, Amt family
LGAIALGFLSGTIPWVSMNIAGRKVSIFAKVDDTLEVFNTHFVGAHVGGIGTGIFATVDGCQAFGLSNQGGAIAGNGAQVWMQLVGGLFIIGWNIVWTSLIMVFIQYVCRVNLGMSDEMLEVGDFAIHGEEPYTFAHYNRQHALTGLRRHVSRGDEEAGVLTGKDPTLINEMPALGDGEIRSVKEKPSETKID